MDFIYSELSSSLFDGNTATWAKFDTLPLATEKYYMTFGVVNVAGNDKVYLCIKNSTLGYTWKLVANGQSEAYDGYIYTGLNITIPTAIPVSFEPISIPVKIKETGFQYEYSFPEDGRIAIFAYPAALGELTHIINITSNNTEELGAWGRIEAVKDGLTYFVYYSDIIYDTTSKYLFKLN